MKTWHVVVAAVVIGTCEYLGSRLRRLARRLHILL
jgi:hypothetical protein